MMDDLDLILEAEKKKIYQFTHIIGSLISIFVLLSFRHSLNTACLVLVCIVSALCLIHFVIIPNIAKIKIEKIEKERRVQALKTAKVFLKPYNDIWKNLEIQNRFCSVKLNTDGVSITIQEKKEPFRKGSIIKSNVKSFNEIWNIFCLNFEWNSRYEGLIDLCRTCKVSVMETTNRTLQELSRKEDDKIDKNKEDSGSISPHEPITNNDNTIKKIDINNASLEEISQLPIINIIMAKKIIKRIHEKGEFKTIDEFSEFLNLSQENTNIIKDKIEFNIIKNIPPETLNTERQVDF